MNATLTGVLLKSIAMSEATYPAQVNLFNGEGVIQVPNYPVSMIFSIGKYKFSSLPLSIMQIILYSLLLY